jgi:hypothetical protein
MIGSIIGGAFALLGMLIAGLFGLACFAFWIWMLVHAITNKGLPDGEKVVWVLVIIFLPFIGSILYFFIGRPKGRALV